MAARRHIPRPEVGYHRHSQALGDHRRLAQLQRRAANLAGRRLVPDRLSVRADGGQRTRRDSALLEQPAAGGGEPLAEIEVQATELARTADQRGADGSALLGRVGDGEERLDVGAKPPVSFLDLDQRRVDAVQRCARHQAEVTEGQGFIRWRGVVSPRGDDDRARSRVAAADRP